MLAACPAVDLAELESPTALVPSQPFVVVARIDLAKAVATPSPTATPLSGRAHVAVRLPEGFQAKGAYVAGDDEHVLTPAPIVAAAYEDAHRAEGARWHAFVTHLHTGLGANTLVRVRFEFTAAKVLPATSRLVFSAGLAPSYPGWPRLPSKFRALDVPTAPAAPRVAP